MAERLIVVGGDGAGMSAATNARRRRPDLEIVALERGSVTSYSACGIPYVVGGEVASLDDLVARTPQQFRAEHRIDVRIRHEAVGIDLDARRLTVRDHAHDRELTLGFDLLHLATGAVPRRPPLPGLDLPHVHGVQTLGDAAQLLEAASSGGCTAVVVVGGGYIGLEMAEAFVRWGADVTVVEAGPQVMSTFDPEMAERIGAALVRHGVDLRTGVGVEAVDEKEVHTSAGAIRADLVVLGTGVAPNAALGAEAGLEVGDSGGYRVDRRQRTSAEGVWAAGDCAETFHLVSQRPIHIALGTVANKTGRVAGINIAGGYATFAGVVGTAVSRICSTEVARTGLGEQEAREAGFEPVGVVVEASSQAGYMPSSRPLVVKLLAEKRTGRLLGGQLVGEEGAGKRIDVLATAITAQLTAEQLVDLDLAYAPTVATVWDALQIAGRQLLGALADA